MGGGDAQSVAPGGSMGGGDPLRPIADMAMVLRDPSALYFLMHQVCLIAGPSALSFSLQRQGMDVASRGLRGFC